MMKKDWYDYFIEMLCKRYPKKSQLTEALTDLLSIEKESVYRRLRKDILFTIPELIKIASAWNISLDEITGAQTKEILFKLQMLNYTDPSEEELDDIRTLIQRLRQIKNFPKAEYMEISNQLPRVFTSRFEYLSRFYLLKWMYQYHDKDSVAFSEVFFHEEVAKLSLSYHVESINIPNITFISDQKIFENLVCDVLYFHSIFLITDNEKDLIKKDLCALLDYLNEVSTKGYWPETGNKVNLYISHISIDTNYSYYYTPEEKLCRIHAFTKNELYAYNPEVVENFTTWMQLKKRSSVLISVADERSRIAFFKKQYELINKL